MNTDYFIFVDLNNSLTKYNLEIAGKIFSSGYASMDGNIDFAHKYINGQANYLPLVINNERSSNFLSFYCSSVTVNYRIEYDTEMTRFHYFPKFPSRLSAVFAFATEEDCRKARDFYQWDLSTVRKFRLLPDALTRVAKVNMEIISLMRYAYRNGMWTGEQVEHIWKHYWSGGGSLEIEIPTMQPPPNTHKKLSSGEIWEYLIEGVLELQGDLHTPVIN